MRLRFAGYAALFDRRDAARDTIRQGAFARTLAGRRDPLPLLWQHRPDLRIGWVETLAEDARGLRVIASLDRPDGAAGLALRRGGVTGLSFGYHARGGRTTGEGRELHDLDLFEVSLVTHPMQYGARVHLVFSPARGGGPSEGWWRGKRAPASAVTNRTTAPKSRSTSRAGTRKVAMPRHSSHASRAESRAGRSPRSCASPSTSIARRASPQ